MEVRGWKKLKFLSAKKFSRLIVATIARPRQTFVMTTIIQVSLLGTKVTILLPDVIQILSHTLFFLNFPEN